MVVLGSQTKQIAQSIRIVQHNHPQIYQLYLQRQNLPLYLQLRECTTIFIFLIFIFFFLNSVYSVTKEKKYEFCDFL